MFECVTLSKLSVKFNNNLIKTCRCQSKRLGQENRKRFSEALPHSGEYFANSEIYQEDVLDIFK